MRLQPFRPIFIPALALALAGCSVLPSSGEVTNSPWTSFADAKAAYERIEPNRTTLLDLRDLNFDPYTAPNITILSYLDIIRQFMPNNSIGTEDLDPSVRECIQARASCSGYQIALSETHNQRVGNVFLDLLNFKRRTLRTGWNFSATVLFNGEKVIYKIWRGQPNITIEHQNENPLGPLQDPGGMIYDKISF